MRQHQLARALGLDTGQRRELRRVLRELEAEGRVLRLRKNRWALPDRGQVVVGRLRVHSSGFGFVTSEIASEPDVYVGRGAMATALDGDTVQVRVVGKVSRRGRRGPDDPIRREGRVVSVVRRERTRIVGLLRRESYYAYIIPDDPRVRQNIRVIEKSEAGGPQSGRKVVVTLDDWTDPSALPQGVITEDLGPADAPGVDMICVLREHGLEETFPAAANAEAEAFPEDPGPEDVAGRRDLRDLLTFTIDPEDARDYDDAVSLRALGADTWELGVHIADVSHYVRPGTGLDAEARLRGNSAYLVDRVVTMLPPYLTSNVCSLAPGRDRLTHTVLLRLNAAGEVLNAESFPSFIHSSARLDYNRVQRFFDGAPSVDIAPGVRDALQAMRRLAATLRRQRLDRGALDLAVPEVRCDLDVKGRPVALYRRGSDEAYHLIEEFMLLANRTVAGILSEAECPALYRIHEAPDAGQWENMDGELARFGYGLTATDQHGLNELFGQLGDTAADYVVTRAVLTNLKRAVYSSSLKPHFGLAFERYTHFTSPIRRYPDLAVHRVLKALGRGGPPPHEHDEMPEIAEHCTATERNAEEAERKSLDIKRLQFLQQRLRNRETGPYRGVILGLRDRGLWVEMTDVLQQGLVPFAALTDDHYEKLPDGSAAVGRRHGTEWRPGMEVTLELTRVDEARRLVDFRLAVPEKPRPRRKRKDTKRRGRRQG